MHEEPFYICLRHGVWGATQVIKDVKRLWTNYGRIVRSELSPTTSVSRNARFRGVRGENSNPRVLQKDTAVSSCDTHQCPVGGHSSVSLEDTRVSSRRTPTEIDNNNLKNNKLKQR